MHHRFIFIVDPAGNIVVNPLDPDQENPPPPPPVASTPGVSFGGWWSSGGSSGGEYVGEAGDPIVDFNPVMGNSAQGVGDPEDPETPQGVRQFTSQVEIPGGTRIMSYIVNEPFTFDPPALPEVYFTMDREQTLITTNPGAPLISLRELRYAGLNLSQSGFLHIASHRGAFFAAGDTGGEFAGPLVKSTNGGNTWTPVELNVTLDEPIDDPNWDGNGPQIPDPYCEGDPPQVIDYDAWGQQDPPFEGEPPLKDDPSWVAYCGQEPPPTITDPEWDGSPPQVSEVTYNDLELWNLAGTYGTMLVTTYVGGESDPQYSTFRTRDGGLTWTGGLNKFEYSPGLFTNPYHGRVMPGPPNTWAVVTESTDDSFTPFVRFSIDDGLTWAYSYTWEDVLGEYQGQLYSGAWSNNKWIGIYSDFNLGWSALIWDLATLSWSGPTSLEAINPDADSDLEIVAAKEEVLVFTTQEPFTGLRSVNSGTSWVAVNIP